MRYDLFRIGRLIIEPIPVHQPTGIPSPVQPCNLVIMTGSARYEAMIESIAHAIHGDYLANAASASGSSPSVVPWSQLPEEFRESNRNQARDILHKLHALGFGIAPAEHARHIAPIELSPSQVEVLARMEHDRWMEEKQRNGWVRGPARDNERKVHPDIVPWEELDEPAREKDRNPVRAIPRLLAAIGFEIVPLP